MDKQSQSQLGQGFREKIGRDYGEGINTGNGSLLLQSLPYGLSKTFLRGR